jgi:transcriptional regulator with XRE-family HTH domain
MTSPEKLFGAILHQLRKGKGLTQQRLALDTALDRSFISLLERGLRQPSLTSLLQLSNALGVKASEIIARVEWRLGDVSRKDKK